MADAEPRAGAGLRIGAPTLVCGFPKSGTTLLTALLDGHPGLLCFPQETWSLKVATRFPKDTWLDHVLASDAVRTMAQGVADGQGDVRDYRGFDFAAFDALARELWRASDRSPRALLESLLEALRRTCGRGECARWVEKSPEQEIELERHASNWNDLRVVHVVRDPRAVLCSFRRKRERSAQDVFAEGLVERWRAGLAAVLAREDRHPGSVTIVRYEDVVTRLRETLGRVLVGLGLPWDDAVLGPTLLGRPWRGNSMYQDAMQGISTESLERWRDEIDPAERALIERCLGTELSALGYPVGDTRAPVGGELGLVLRRRSGLRPRYRALRRMRRLRREPPAPVGGASFRRAFGSC